jgi:coenzyme F420-dependent glucose-6-phosphate dehydrogenase
MQLVGDASRADSIGFDAVMISDHLQPWTPAQGHAAHVWTTIGAIARETDRVEVGVGVTAMISRNHPIDVAHAAATAAVLLGGRFVLGVGAGERLNEQPYAQRWPRIGERRERLAEAIDVIRALWSGEPVNHDGTHWRVENLTLYERPPVPPRILVAAAGKRSARLAGESGDGMIGVSPDAHLVAVYRGTGGTGSCVGQVHVSLAATMDDALDNAWTWWPNGAVAPAVLSELARPEHFAAVAASARRESIGDVVVCATDAGPIVAAIDRFIGAGFDTVMLHQIGPDQQRLADLGAGELLGHYRGPD